MNNALATKDHRWLALAGLVLVVTAGASAPFFLSGWYATQDQGLPITVEGYSPERLPDEPRAFTSTPAERLSLTDASTSAPLDPLATTLLVDAGPASLDYPSSLVSGQTPDIIDTDAALLPGQAPDIFDTGTALASESLIPLGAGLGELERRTMDATKERIIAAAVTSSPVVLDAPSTAVSIAPSQAEGPDQIFEPWTLALLGLGLGLTVLGFALEAKHHRWLALAGLFAATQAIAPVFLAGLYATQDQGLPITVEGYSSERLADEPTPAEPPSLLTDASTLAPLDLAYMADSSADPGVAGGGFASGGFSAGSNAALAIGAMPTIGGYVGATPPTPAWSGGRRVAVATAPRSSTERSTGSALTTTKSPGTETPNAIVTGVGQAHQGSSSRSTPTGERAQNSTPQIPTDQVTASIPSSHTSIAPGSVTGALHPGQTPDIIDTDTALLPGQAPDIFDTGTALASESLIPLGAGLEEPEQLAKTALASDAPTASPLAVPEPGTLALLGVGLLGLAGLTFSRRKQ